jgi:predicted CxxxxCH...CXXCH cytochrome family protein
MTKHTSIIGAAVLVALLVFPGCKSELKDTADLPVAPTVQGLHPAGFVTVASPDFHGKLLALRTYDMSECKTCHGSDLAGGIAKVSCSSSGCHIAADGGPLACYTCHGDFAKKLAYPQDASHIAHIAGSGLSNVHLKCSACHQFKGLSDPGHFGGDNPDGAEVVLNADTSISLAALTTKGTVGTPSYNSSTHTCSNIYCHGNFTNGNNVAPVWNGQPDQAYCGSCHGAAKDDPLPKAPHFSITACYGCHEPVVDAAKNISTPAKHIDGKLRRYAQEVTDW